MLIRRSRTTRPSFTWSGFTRGKASVEARLSPPVLWLHDEGSVKAAVYLFNGVLVGVVHVGAGVRGRELVGEAPARPDGFLGDGQHPIHGVGQVYAV